MTNKYFFLLVVWVILINSTVNYAYGQSPKEVAAKTIPSVVVLEIISNNGKTISIGSGFSVRNGVIATNYHVIKGFLKGKVKPVNSSMEGVVDKIVAVDILHDIALVQVSRINSLPLLEINDGVVAIGETVYAVGNPEGLQGTFSQGIISGIRQIESKKLIQITAPISHGSSGGPIVDSIGKVVGIAVSTISDGQNLNFAIPSMYLNQLLDSIGIDKSPRNSIDINKSPEKSVIIKEDGSSFVSIDISISTGNSNHSGDHKVREGNAEMIYIAGSGKISDFWLDETPVTVRQFKLYCASTGRSMPSPPTWGWIDDHPMVNVSWDDANAYAKWAGCRLPTSEEFEYAATERGLYRTYPWGNINPQEDDSKLWGSTKTPRKSTAPVKRSENIFINYLGLSDMGGNVWHWCNDGPDVTNHYRIGGSWSSTMEKEFRATFKSGATLKGIPFQDLALLIKGDSFSGFRLAK